MIEGLIWAIVLLSPPPDLDLLDDACRRSGGDRIAHYQIALGVGEHHTPSAHTMIWCLKD